MVSEAFLEALEKDIAWGATVGSRFAAGYPDGLSVKDLVFPQKRNPTGLK